MTKFLHLADIHLGIRRYRLEERTRDFFFAWRDCIQRYALEEQVSFVLIVGDLFDQRRVEPQAMNHAMLCLVKLREAGIPVIAIEGNHDQREKLQQYSWLRSLSQWGFIKLLEPAYEEGGVVKFEPWNAETRSGSFIDICGVRIFGSTWYGATVNHMLPALMEELRQHRSEQLFNILMLHTDVEGQLSRPIPALPLAKINELRAMVDYLALGHTHRKFEIDGWVYNPGSLEACSVDEYEFERGAFLVEVTGGHHTVRFVQDYHQRPIIRLKFDVTGRAEPEELRQELFAYLRREVKPHSGDESDGLAPILELSLRGHLGFKSALLELSRIREEIKQEFRPLNSMVRDQTVPVEYAVAAGLHQQVTRGERERRVIEDLIARDARFRDRARETADLVLEAKRLALTDEQPAKITELIEQRLAEAQSRQATAASD
jgi:DNA repair exonuclease SbcCD nuclease subunit